jgi:hypothetical protein
MLSKIRMLGLVLIAAAIGLPAIALAQETEPKVWVSTKDHPIARIAVVGCASQGDTDNEPSMPPENTEKIIEIDKKLSHRVSFYTAYGAPLVLGPQGWNCLEIFGANGNTLYIAPDLFHKEDLFAKDGGFRGPAIEVSEVDGDTPGRFEVARVIARVFPAHKAFAQKVINEGVVPADTFHFGPYPTDQVTAKGDDLVEFETPPQSLGLGTMSKLHKNPFPIDGTIKLGGLLNDKMFRAIVRLEDKDKDLIPVIIKRFEKDNPEDPSGN